LFRAGLLTRFLFSCLIDADRTDTADFENPENAELRHNSRYPAWGEFITALEQRLEQFETRNHVDEIRSDVSLACMKFGEREQGIYTLTVPTGGGKTLASLRFALEHAQRHKLNRIFFIIPYTSIIDQNAHEVRQIFAELSKKYQNELVLEHHSNLTPDKDTLQSKILAENWDAPIVFITSVQLLESLFNSGTRGVRRMHQLAESVIVFDEIQTLPVRLTHLFNNAMNFLVDICGSSVVLCTATQPCLHNVDTEKGAIELAKDPEIMPNVSKLFYDLRRVEVIDQRKPGGLSTAEIAELTKDELMKSGSVLVVVNTKQSARDLFRCCRDFDAKIFHLSTDMCPAHRMTILTKIRSSLEPDNSTPIVCISTLLIEAGVDVDFGSVIRYLAGCDSIAQAAGRCNRNGLRKIGRVTIVNPKDENIGSLIDIEVGREIAQRVLDECAKDKDTLNSDLLHPDVMNRFFQYYFYDRKKEMVYPVSKKIFNQSETLLRLLSTNNQSLQNYSMAQEVSRHPGYPLLHSFKSAAKAFKAIDSETQGVIVPYKKGEEIIARLCASNNILKEYELMKTAQRYSVNCYKNRITKLGIGEAGALHDIQGSGILCLKPDYYSQNFGVSDEPVTDASELLAV
jgi:CRISPR-associated endonuclease/helicase Cas3